MSMTGKSLAGTEYQIPFVAGGDKGGIILVATRR